MNLLQEDNYLEYLEEYFKQKELNTKIYKKNFIKNIAVHSFATGCSILAVATSLANFNLTSGIALGAVALNALLNISLAKQTINYYSKYKENKTQYDIYKYCLENSKIQ